MTTPHTQLGEELGPPRGRAEPNSNALSSHPRHLEHHHCLVIDIEIEREKGKRLREEEKKEEERKRKGKNEKRRKNRK
jgi:hypothetical protein